MYEKLGELLSESLEKGEVLQFTEEDKFTEEKFSIFENTNTAETKSDPKKQKQNAQKEADEAAEKLRQSEKEKARKAREQKKSEAPKKGTGVVYKKLSPELERAYRTLDISVSATLEDVKKAYKEKLKYYHPDRHQENEVLQKVATTKTKQVVEAYNLLTLYLQNR